MADPSYRLRVATSGVPLRGTPGHVLTFNGDGESVSGQPTAGAGLVSFNGRTDPAVLPADGDYNAGQLVNTSDAPGDSVEDALNAIWALIQSGPASPGTVRVSGSDSAAEFLGLKLAAGAGLQLTTIDPGGDEALQIDLITAFAITGFGRTGPSVVLIGSSVVSPGFTASYNQAATAANLTDTEGNNDPIALPATNFASGHTFTKNAYGASVGFTLHASGPPGTGSATAGASIAWGSNVYTGAAVDPGAYTAGFIQGLAASLKLGAAGNYAQNAAAGQSVFFCARTGFGLTVGNFFVGGFPFACSRVATAIPVTINGISEGFDVFRGDNTGLGPFTLTVQ
jgi:hypothetical protein